MAPRESKKQLFFDRGVVFSLYREPLMGDPNFFPIMLKTKYFVSMYMSIILYFHVPILYVI